MIFKNKKVFFIILALGMLLHGISVKAEEIGSNKIFYLNEKGVASGPLFSKDELLYPGKKIVKEFYIANNNNFKCYLKNLSVDGRVEKQDNTQLDKYTEEYIDFMNNAQVKFYVENKELFSGNAEEFLKVNIIQNDSLSINEMEKKKCYLEICLGEKASNATKNLNYIFNINANYYNENKELFSLVKTGSLLDNKMLFFIGGLLCIGGSIKLIRSKAAKLN